MSTLNEQLAIIRRHQTEAPVLVTEIAKSLGVQVFRATIMPKDLSGMIRRNANDPNRYDIYVNAAHSENRRRFTIAHELAHLILHRSLIGDGITDDAMWRSGLSNIVEAQANRLAADILMPRHLMDPFIARGVTDVAELARRFLVSEDAMKIRLGVLYGTPSGAD